MASKIKEAEQPTDEQILKKGRHRKKQLYNSILQQMEFYFSDSNLTKDRYLSQLVQESRYVDLDVFLKFNKIRKLTSNVEDIKKAIRNSKLIELSEDQSTVCRKEPVKEKINVDECTIYVERLQSDATHEWLTSVFSEFGNVVYVSIPKYKHNNVLKGFAFIEFDNEHEAEKAVSYFESIGCKMPAHTEPAELCSIATFESSNENAEEKPAKKVEDVKSEKVEDVSVNGKTKRKFDEIEEKGENEEINKKRKTEEVVPESDDSENKKKKKLKKEHKKKNFLKDLGLQVLSKKEWKRMRNRYLDMQKKKMKEFKKYLYRAKYGEANYDERPNRPIEDTEEKKSDLSVQSQDMNNGERKKTNYEFQEGLIMKIKLVEPVSDARKLKNEIKSLSSDIMYVDVPNVGSEDVYLRFNSKDKAKEFCTHEFGGKKEVLVGDEERSYWEKMQQDRDLKLQKSTKKKRGRDKLLTKAKRIKFDD